MAGKLGTAEKWREKKGGRKMVGTKWREENGGRKKAETIDRETNLLEKTKICAVPGNMSGKIMKWYFRHGQSRNWPVGPAVTRKAGVHAVHRPFGFGRAET